MSTEPAGEHLDLTLRPAVPADAEALAALFLAAREAARPAMPPPVSGPAEVRTWFAAVLEPAGPEVPEVWVAERGGVPVGYLVLETAWLHSLYVAPELTGQGIGSLLLDLAKSRRPRGFGLWVFESNAAARRFYRRHGLWELERTDGTANEEGAPDVRMVWPGADPVRFLRAEIDEVDAELARVLARRAALTAAVQAHKEVPGPAGRDPAREAEIVRRMAGLAPGLGADRIAAIMDVVITTSLDAAEAPGAPTSAPETSERSPRMDRPPLPEAARELLSRPNPAVIATVRPDGQPVTVATWYLLEGDRVLVNMDEGRKRLDHLRADPRVSLTVLAGDDWYTHLSLRGRVVEMRQDDGLADIDRLARHYTGRPYAVRDRGRVSAWIEIDSWHGWGAMRHATG